MNPRPILAGGVICDKGEDERANEITKHLFESPVPAPR
jgi:hypothetical protein